MERMELETHVFDLFDTIPLQPLTQACPRQLMWHQPPVAYVDAGIVLDIIKIRLKSGGVTLFLRDALSVLGHTNSVTSTVDWVAR